MASLTRTAGIAAVLLASATAVAAPAAGAAGARLAPLRSTANVSTGGDYLVVLKRSAPVSRVAATADRAEDAGGQVRTTYRTAVRGFAATLSPAQLATVRADPDVAYVQPNRRYSATETQNGVTWGLDRVDQRSRTLNHKYFWRGHSHTGRVYVVDTGIKAQPTLEGAKTVTSTIGGSLTDCAGHGTHVAGIVGDRDYGVAKGSAPIGVKVLDCDGNGTSETVTAGLDYVLAHRPAGVPTVVNLSLGGDHPGHDAAVEAAVQRLIDDGITVVIAAGNATDDACDYSPGLVPDAITVAASTKSDRRSSFSNYGSCIDLYAPGSDITSDWITKDSHGNWQAARLSGTSMATPFVTAAALLYAQWYPSSTPAQVAAALRGNATKGVITESRTAGNGNLLMAKPLIPAPPATTWKTRIRYRTALVRDQKVCSPNGRYCLARRASDHHLRLYRVSTGKAIWSNKVVSSWTYVRSDGDLVSYDAYGAAVWSTGTSSSSAVEVRVRDTGYLSLVKVSTGKSLWRST